MQLITLRYGPIVATLFALSLNAFASEVGTSTNSRNSSTNAKNSHVQDVDCGHHLEESGLEKILTKSNHGYSINKASISLRSVAVTLKTPDLTGYEVEFTTTSKIRWHGHLAFDHKGTLKHFVVKYPNRDIAAQCPRPKDFDGIGRHWRGDLNECRLKYAKDNGFEDVMKSAQTTWCQGKSANLVECKSRFAQDKNFAEALDAAENAWCRIHGYGS